MTAAVPRRPVRHRRSLLWLTFQTLFRVMTSLMFDLKVYGARNIPRRGGALLLTNHESYLDPVLIGVRLRRPLNYMAKSGLFTHPLFGAAIRNLHAFPVRQGQGDVGAVRETIQRLRDGHLLNIFPEGTRSENGQLQPLESGVALVVKRAQVPVIPVLIEGSFEAWPRDHRLPRPHPVHVLYGKPLRLDGLKSAQIIELLEQTFRRMQHELADRIRSERT